jgi:diaminopimelate decarboxylase
MSQFVYRSDQLYAEDVSLAEIASRFGTPTYVYSKRSLSDKFLAYQNALSGTDSMVCYAVKANSNLAVLNLLADLGAGFDVVSAGELARVLAAGGEARKSVFSGVGKRADEIEYALNAGIYCINIESEGELAQVQKSAARLNTIAPISFRINPDVDALTHPYIATGLKEGKFGIDIDTAITVFRQAEKLANVDIIGVDCHIGSQLTEITPFLDALDRTLALIDQLIEVGIVVQHLDLGGGLGVRYSDESPPATGDYIEAILEKIHGRHLKLILEPGRSITANAGILLTRVEYLKNNGDKIFVVVDAAMNDMLRPALYDAWLNIEPVQNNKNQASFECDIVGPVCESADFLGKNRQLSVGSGDLLCVHSAGAYGFSMSSNYNSRPRAAEVMVDHASAHLVRKRESVEDLMLGERTLPGKP